MIPWLDDDSNAFPDPSMALGPGSPAPGLLAAGGSLTPERLEAAYRLGIFPWYSDGEPILWWCPDPRMVLKVDDFRVSHSLRKTLRRFAESADEEVRIDGALSRVLDLCSGTPRRGQQGTWITPEIKDAYMAWHRAGRVHSFETWVHGELVGGLYGVSIGRMFYGESMFSLRTDASKIALAALVAFCRRHRIQWIDCQQRTAHLASLGAREVPRSAFLAHLNRVVMESAPLDWTYHRSLWEELEMPTPSD